MANEHYAQMIERMLKPKDSRWFHIKARDVDSDEAVSFYTAFFKAVLDLPTGKPGLSKEEIIRRKEYFLRLMGGRRA